MKEGTSKDTFFYNFGDESIVVLNYRKHMKTIFNCPSTNLPVLQCIDSSNDEANYGFLNEITCLDYNCFNNTSAPLRVAQHTIPTNNGNEIHPSNYMRIYQEIRY